jgi:hypothetical protein
LTSAHDGSDSIFQRVAPRASVRRLRKVKGRLAFSTFTAADELDARFRAAWLALLDARHSRAVHAFATRIRIVRLKIQCNALQAQPADHCGF